MKGLLVLLGAGEQVVHPAGTPLCNASRDSWAEAQVSVYTAYLVAWNTADLRERL